MNKYRNFVESDSEDRCRQNDSIFKINIKAVVANPLKSPLEYRAAVSPCSVVANY